MLTSPVASAATAQLTVNVNQSAAPINPTQWGHILEDISHSVEGGLYANVVRNSNMKEGSANPPSSWSVVTDGGGTGSIALDTTQPLNSANGSALKLSITANGSGQRVGVANAGFYGVPVHPSTTYTASFFARSDGGFSGPLTVSLESNAGTVFASATVTAITGSWAKYSVSLSTAATAPNSTDNRFVISANGVGAGQSVWFNIVQCFPPTFAAQGNLRTDLMQKMDATAPGFIRVPGGNYLEGNQIATRFDWKKTLGPVESRPGHQNDAWGYWSTDQMGLLEYLELAEQLHAEPLLAVYAGYSLKHVVVAQADLQPYIQDALDEIEYATGSTSTTWGAQRAADGHPAPFTVNFVEIGNEDWFDTTGSYDSYRYPLFYDAIKAKYPNIKLVASTSVTSRPMDVLDDHYYNGNPSWFTNNAGRYDFTDRHGAKHVIGEYAATANVSGNPTGTLADALGEAGFMTGLERNADVVVGAAYAPVLAHVNSYQWTPNLIGFDAGSSYGSPSYYVQEMFGTLLGDHVLTGSLSGAPSNVNSVASRTNDGAVYITVVNPTTSAVSTAVTINGATTIGATATATTLTGSPSAVNSITAPNTVVPTTASVAVGANFTYSFPASSVTVLQLSTTGSYSPFIAVNKGVSLRATTPGYTDRYARVQSGLGVSSVITASSTTSDKQDASLIVRTGLASSACFSFESRSHPGQFLRHYNYRIQLNSNDGTSQFAADATFCAKYGNNGQGVSWQSYNFPTRYLRHYSSQLWIASNGGALQSDAKASWADDTSWLTTPAWWRSDAAITSGGYQSLQATNAGSTDHYVQVLNALGVTSVVNASSSAADMQAATFKIVPGLADSACYSFESRTTAGQFLRHNNYRIRLDTNDSSTLFAADATFCAELGNNGQGVSWQSYNFPNRYLRHYNDEVWIALNGGPNPSDSTTGYADDTSWLIAAPWAP